MLVPSTRTKLGRRSFHVAAPAVWNALPPHLLSPTISRGQLRTGLKKHLFTQGLRTPLRTFVEEHILYITFTPSMTGAVSVGTNARSFEPDRVVYIQIITSRASPAYGNIGR